jgi:hypothetical protein
VSQRLPELPTSLSKEAVALVLAMGENVEEPFFKLTYTTWPEDVEMFSKMFTVSETMVVVKS